MNTPRIHAREMPLNRATSELSIMISKFLSHLGDDPELSDITYAEVFRVLHGAYDTNISGFIKSAIRQERHPNDPDKPGGWA